MDKITDNETELSVIMKLKNELIGQKQNQNSDYINKTIELIRSNKLMSNLESLNLLNENHTLTSELRDQLVLEIDKRIEFLKSKK